MTINLDVSEDAGGAPATLTSTVPRGDRIVGVTIAGRSAGGVGVAVTGTYGALTINADGSLIYQLDGTDRDTRLIGAGETAYERFAYTYEAGRETRTETVVIAVAGFDQAGIEVTRSNETTTFRADATIPESARLIADVSIFPSAAVAVGDLFYGDSSPVTVINRGAILGSAPIGGFIAGIATATFRAGIVNEGRIALTASTGEGGSIGIVGSGQVPPLALPVINRGVVQVVSQASGTFPPQVTGIEGRTVDNIGTVYVVAHSGLAYGIGSRPAPITTLSNSGLIFASSGDRTEVSGLSATGVFAYGSDLSINNTGTIAAEATAVGMHSVAFRVFTNTTNALAGGTVTNSGRVVADYALWSVGGILGSIGFWNVGHVEGDWLSDKNTMSVLNAASALWLGRFSLGLDPDLVRNDGLISGMINLGSGADLYDGSRGANGTQVFGGAGNDVLSGGSGADQFDGAEGDDFILGGSGDRLTGGSGTDRFIVSGSATVSDFERGRDILDLSPLSPIGISTIASAGETLVVARTAQGDVTVTVRGNITVNDIVTSAPGTTQAGSALSEILVARSSAEHALSGAAGDDVLVGNDGADALDGGTGDDIMFGGDGDDVYYVDVFGDRAIETANGGTDEVRTTTGYLLAPYIENGRILGSDSIGLTGNDLDNILYGNDGDNQLNGQAGNDQLIGGAGRDQMFGGLGSDVFVFGTTLQGNDIIIDFDATVDRIDLGGGGFTSVTEQFGTTTLGYAGGRIQLNGIVGFTLAEWNGFVNGSVAPIVSSPPPFFLLVPTGAAATVLGSGTVFGTIGGTQQVTVRDVAGTVTFDGSYNAGGDRIILAGPASNYSVSRSGATVQISDGDTVVRLPAGAVGADVVFGDGVRSLTFESATTTVRLGSQTVTTAAAPVTAAAGPAVSTGTTSDTLAAQLIVNPGQAATAIGRLTIFGSIAGQETVTVSAGAQVTFDGSFNAGGDTISLAGVRAGWTVSRSGATVQLIGPAGDTVAVPVGTTGSTIRFADGDRTLIFDAQAGAVRLGDVVVTSTPTPVLEAPSAIETLGFIV